MRASGAPPLPPGLREEIDRSNEALERAIEWLDGRVAAPEAAAIRDALRAGGKRIRPVLCVEAWRACGGPGDPDLVRDLAVALEWIHTYSLVHDDLPCMDNAALRRGRPTTHRVHGVGVATRGGALLIPLAALWSLDRARRHPQGLDLGRRWIRELMRGAGAGGMVGGQVLDLLAEGREIDRDALDGLHARKTGALLVASLRMGGIAAGAGPERLAGLDRFGRAVGLAFQIADDVLDSTGDASLLGKNPSDQVLRKSTYVGLLGVAGARDRAHQLVREGVRELERVGIRSEGLEALARYIVERDH